MSDHKPDTRATPNLQALLGYLNFSEGRPDPRFQKALDDLAASLPPMADPASPPTPPWQPLHQALRQQLDSLRAAGGAFADSAQADAVLELTFTRLLPAYRRHHADLLAHQPDADLSTPFFLARAFEAVLAQGRPWDEADRVVAGALRTLNDFVGHRPVAVLETRPRGEPYDHERVRPVPLYLHDAGVARGRYHDLVTRALGVLAATDPDLLDEAAFDPKLLDELACDPRAYDFDHPVHRRPNYLFGEWDPHHIDNQGRYRRYVARQVVLDAMLERVDGPGPISRDEALTEAAVVLAGTLLMATATSGRGPEAHDSTTTFSTLLPRIARLRDAFYDRTLQRMAGQGPHGARLRQEAAAQRQPFAAARQHLNARLAAIRATQVQQRFLALLYADMGFPDAARAEADRIPVASVRLTTELHGLLIHADRLAAAGDLAAARPLLIEAFGLLRRGIACGAFADPWNILGFQALFPISHAREDAVRDPRAHELVALVERLLALHARLLAEAGARGRDDLVEPLRKDMHGLAVWWDRFATPTVSEVRNVYGMEALASAESVAEALARWHQQGQAPADLAFWRGLLPGFHSPKAFALVLDSLLGHADFQAAMGLLVGWLSQVEQVPLDGGEHSFHALALRWMLGVTSSPSLPPDRAWPLVRRFLDTLEANAEALGQVPALEEQPGDDDEDDEDDEDDDNPFQAAYDGVTYQDSTDQDEGAVSDGGEPRERFSLEDDSDHLLTVLHFLTTQARLWSLAARHAAQHGGPTRTPEEHASRTSSLAAWLHTAQGNLRDLLELLDAVQAFPVPRPEGGFDSMVEFDRRRTIKLRVLHAVVGTALETEMAIGALLGSLPRSAIGPAGGAPWVVPALDLERAILRRDPAAARAALPIFLAAFQSEPLLFTAVEEGGDARAMLRARLAQTVLRALAMALPRLGLLRETHLLLRTALSMERGLPTGGRGITEFNTLFQAAFQGVVECLVASTASWPADQAGDPALVHRLDTLCSPFVALWMEHSRGLHLAVLEGIRSEKDWVGLRDFIRRYGRDLFDVRFLTLGNLRGLLHQGLDPWLNHLIANPDPLHPVRLIDDLGRGLDQDEALAQLRVVVQAVAENYDEYRDYNTTSARAAYGDNLYVLLDFLRLKAAYERHAWQLKPLGLAHDVLARHGRNAAALLWQEQLARIVREPAAEHVKRLADLEKEHATTIRTVTDRLHERFVAPLALDRLAALVEPAMKEARAGGPHPAFDRFRDGLIPFTATPGGVGLDVPPWLRRLQAEAQRVHHARTPVAALAESTLALPQRLLTLDEFTDQFLPGERPGGLDR